LQSWSESYPALSRNLKEQSAIRTFDFPRSAWEAQTRTVIVSSNRLVSCCKVGIVRVWPKQSQFRAMSHQFKKKHFKKFTFCTHCDSFIWGVVNKQGYICESTSTLILFGLSSLALRARLFCAIPFCGFFVVHAELQVCGITVHKKCVEKVKMPCDKHRPRSQSSTFSSLRKNSKAAKNEVTELVGDLHAHTIVDIAPLASYASHVSYLTLCRLCVGATLHIFSHFSVLRCSALTDDHATRSTPGTASSTPF
jgi:hypothetical protein